MQKKIRDSVVGRIELLAVERKSLRRAMLREEREGNLKYPIFKTSFGILKDNPW